MEAKRAALYTRVSTSDKHHEMQERELVEYVKRRGFGVFVRNTATRVSRDAPKNTVQHSTHYWTTAVAIKVDFVVVWKFDRFARVSKATLLNALELFRKLGDRFCSCTEAIDASAETVC